jgi:hypothetical protein
VAQTLGYADPPQRAPRRSSARTGAASTARGSRAHGRAQAGRRAPARVRWDRLGRLAMLFVLAALLYLYLGAGLRTFSAWRQRHADNARVAAMQHEHEALQRQRDVLGRRGTDEAMARRLGMAHSDELQYVVSGLPNN